MPAPLESTLTTDLAAVTQSELNTIARSLNRRPRQTLGWKSPSVAFAEVVASTTERTTLSGRSAA